MKLTGNETSAEMNEKINQIEVLLDHPGTPDDLKKQLQELKTIAAVFSMRHWLPEDEIRKLLMLILSIVGVVGIFSGKMSQSLVLLAVPFFSPRIVAYACIFFGRIR